MHKQKIRMRILIAIIIFSTSLNSQSNNSSLRLELGFKIQEQDTLLSYQIEYDSLSRKSRITNYSSEANRIKEYYYRCDTIIELHLTELNDTLKQIVTIDRNGKIITIEDRTYGFLTQGNYSKGISNYVRKYNYNDSNEMIESIVYTENRDTIRHYFYNNISDTKCSSDIRIQKVSDSNGNNIGEIISQYGQNCQDDIKCENDCTKYIQLKTQLNEFTPNSSILRIYIEDGDTTCVSQFIKKQMPNNHHTQYDEHIYFDGSSSHYSMSYYFENDLYLKESYSWRDNRWILNTLEETSWSEDKLQKHTKRTTFRKGQMINENISMVKYEYRKPMHNK